MKTLLFVVEGVHDETHLKRLYPDIQTISVGGSAVNEDALNFLKQYQHKFEIVLLLDPDYPGHKIRQKLERELSRVRHIFVDANKAKTQKKIGIEHMQKTDLDEALKHVYIQTHKETLSKKAFIELNLQGSEEGVLRRQTLSKKLHLGQPNAKTLFKRLNMIGMTKQKIKDLL